MIKIFNDKKGDIFNISDLVSNRLRNLEVKFSLLIGPTTPNISTSDSVPMLDINITPQTIQETVKDMERQGSKVKRYQKYLLKQTSEDQE